VSETELNLHKLKNWSGDWIVFGNLLFNFIRKTLERSNRGN
jgi:hypothetical protein